MLPVVTLPQADKDIDSFAKYIAQDSLNSAIRFLDQVEETQSTLSEFPLIASSFESTLSELQNMRWIPVKDFPNHLIFYIPSDENITIVRVFHKAQNIGHILI